MGDGISEEILNTLAQVDGLRVAGRSSSFSLKAKNTKEVREKLNVGNVLEGSLQRHGNRVRVTAELIDARNGFRVWTDTYDRELESAFALQDEIARFIVDGLKVKFAVRSSAHEQPVNGMDNRYLQALFADLTHPTGVNSIDIDVPLRNPPTPSTAPHYTSPEGLEPRRQDTSVIAAPPVTVSTPRLRDRASEPALRPNRIAADVAAAPPVTRSSIGVSSRASQPALRSNKITADVAAAPPVIGSSTNVRSRASEPGSQTNKVTADAPGSIQGFVKDANGGAIKGADVRIESRDGKHLLRTVKTDPNGRYTSQGLQPGVYRVTLVVNGAVKASIMNTQTKVNQPTQLNFDFKATSQGGTLAGKGRKHMVWVPNRTGSHIGGTWVEVDDKGNGHAQSNMQTYTTPQ